ncbi:PTS sugar transporter subunit IIB [uncultured Anaerococcus sp.]|uniref:PTS sugar transporter subunit IIB n=1 Tax=uncultured Anaerococcus sp. TaxID=293428 RepID=UPI0025E596B2|nr:PTS sugar transporter subunit IIB [uncultured Anaerococcus sp.]
MGKIRLARVDSRLASGNLVKEWTKAYKLDKLIIANDKTKRDTIRIEVMDLTVPVNVRSIYLKVSEVRDFLKNNKGDYFLLVENTGDLEKIIDNQIKIEEVNIGAIHMAPPKKSLTQMVAVDDNDLRILKGLKKLGIKVSIKNLPIDRDQADLL